MLLGNRVRVSYSRRMNNTLERMITWTCLVALCLMFWAVIGAWWLA